MTLDFDILGNVKHLKLRKQLYKYEILATLQSFRDHSNQPNLWTEHMLKDKHSMNKQQIMAFHNLFN